MLLHSSLQDLCLTRSLFIKRKLITAIIDHLLNHERVMIFYNSFYYHAVMLIFLMLHFKESGLFFIFANLFSIQ